MYAIDYNAENFQLMCVLFDTIWSALANGWDRVFIRSAAQNRNYYDVTKVVYPIELNVFCYKQKPIDVAYFRTHCVPRSLFHRSIQLKLIETVNEKSATKLTLFILYSMYRLCIERCSALNFALCHASHWHSLCVHWGAEMQKKKTQHKIHTENFVLL